MIAIDSKSYPYLAVKQATTFKYEFLLNTKSLEEIIEMQNNIIMLGASIGIDYEKIKNVYGSEIWNAAIEKAALIVQPVPHIDEERKCEDIAIAIRKLKI